MIHYLLDSSGLWRLLREEQLRDAWLETITLRAIGSCAPQRAEFRRSARNAVELWCAPQPGRSLVAASGGSRA